MTTYGQMIRELDHEEEVSRMTARQQEVPAIFGRRLIRERESRGWSMREAGFKAGISASTSGRTPPGRSPIPGR